MYVEGRSSELNVINLLLFLLCLLLNLDKVSALARRKQNTVEIKRI